MRLTALLWACTVPMVAACNVSIESDDQDQQAPAAANAAENRAQPPGQSAPSGAGNRVATQVPPELQNLQFLVDISDRKLGLFNGNQLVATHPVAVGTKEWPTPTGSWDIHQVDLNPEWVPPKDESWAEDEETKAPGDPENPMGRARLVYRMPNTIHGTNETESLGKASSHGSIRVANELVVQLAEMLLKAGGSWEGDAWFQQMLKDRTKEYQIPLADPIPIVVRD